MAKTGTQERVIIGRCVTKEVNYIPVTQVTRGPVQVNAISATFGGHKPLSNRPCRVWVVKLSKKSEKEFLGKKCTSKFHLNQELFSPNNSGSFSGSYSCASPTTVAMSQGFIVRSIQWRQQGNGPHSCET